MYFIELVPFQIVCYLFLGADNGGMSKRRYWDHIGLDKGLNGSLVRYMYYALRVL